MALRAVELRRILLPRIGGGEAALPPLTWRSRPASTSAPADDELAGKSAYEVLGVGETSSSAEIKASFHRLAKETHPDVAAAAGSRRFLQILAAYEILSDSQRRAHYDSYLRSQRRVVQKHPRPSQFVYPSGSGSGIVVPRESNVVEWLKWYRLTIDDIVTKKRVATGSGYFDRLESDLYTAIHAAYYGPDVDSMDVLPDCFEAEERYWLFEPRCYMHDTGGWYIETFGRDKKGRTIPSQRQWDGFNEHSEKRLHPAMYLAALAYRSLDLEDAGRRQWNVTSFLQLPLSHIRQMFKKIVNGEKGLT